MSGVMAWGHDPLIKSGIFAIASIKIIAYWLRSPGTTSYKEDEGRSNSHP